MKEKIVCVWIGTFKDKDEFYGKYLDINYRQSPSTSPLVKMPDWGVMMKILSKVGSLIN
jgi:hypothetical protein